MGNDTIRKYRVCVISYLIDKYELNWFEAVKIVRYSSFTQMIRKCPEEVVHDPVEVWAEKIYEEHKERNKEREQQQYGGGI